MYSKPRRVNSSQVHSMKRGSGRPHEWANRLWHGSVGTQHSQSHSETDIFYGMRVAGLKRRCDRFQVFSRDVAIPSWQDCLHKPCTGWAMVCVDGLNKPCASWAMISIERSRPVSLNILQCDTILIVRRGMHCGGAHSDNSGRNHHCRG